MRQRARAAILHSTALALACVASYLLTAKALTQLHEISTIDDRIGGMWAVIATAFVYRMNHDESMAAAFSRMAATLLSFVLCLIYLSLLPFHVWGLGLLIGVGALTMLLLNRPDDVITTSVTTTVLLVLAAVNPHDAWQQPILRLADTVVGIAVGIAFSWVGLQLTRRRPQEHEPTADH